MQPARDVGADDVLQDDDERGTDDRTEKGAGPSGNHHQQRFCRRRQVKRLRADELVVLA